MTVLTFRCCCSIYSMQMTLGWIPVGQCNGGSSNTRLNRRRPVSHPLCVSPLWYGSRMCAVSLFIPSLGMSVCLPPALSALWSMNQICAVIVCVVSSAGRLFPEYQRQKCLVYLSRWGFLPQMAVFVDLSSFRAVLSPNRAVFVFIWWLCNSDTRLSSSLCL